MRRLMGMVVAVSLCMSLLTPMVNAMLLASHTCCVRNMQRDAATIAMSATHCGHGAHRIPSSSSFSSLDQGPCHGCCSCLGPVVSIRQQARPDTSFFAPAPKELHSFLHEFYPTEDSGGEFHQSAGRAPPSSEPLR